ncbi:MAG: Type 1 glutamine amidotransferase-like domain-containing protein [Candidatus Woykebacteria bacterium]
MKTLLLTSQGLNVKDEILKILPKPPRELRVAHITTASKDEKDKSYVNRDTKELESLGFAVKEINIANLDEKRLREILSNKDIIYVQGGNTFYLLKCTKESGFDKVVKELIGKGIIYIGKSAGSYIACPTIEQSSWTHDHNIYGLTDLTALSLVPFGLYVHYVPADKAILKEKISEFKYPLKILTDDQAILVKEDTYELVGKGPEVKL